VTTRTVRGLVGVLVLLCLPLQASSATSPQLLQRVLVSGPEHYVVSSPAAGAVTVSARPVVGPAPPVWNRREILVAPGEQRSRDQTVCATWTGDSRDLDQQGLAVRLRTGPGDRLRTLTLTKNTYGYFVWVFNLLSWDSRRAGDPWRELGQFDMGDVLTVGRTVRPFPWRVCLRARGRQLGFKVWLPRQEAEPSWTDPVHTRWTRVSHRLDRPGVPGWYAGHLEPGDSVAYTDMTTTFGDS
jgi:hypothetical protein